MFLAWNEAFRICTKVNQADGLVILVPLTVAFQMMWNDLIENQTHQILIEWPKCQAGHKFYQLRMLLNARVHESTATDSLA